MLLGPGRFPGLTEDALLDGIPEDVKQQVANNLQAQACASGALGAKFQVIKARGHGRGASLDSSDHM